MLKYIKHVSRHLYRHVHGHMCPDLRIDMCIDMCIDMRLRHVDIDMCMDMCTAGDSASDTGPSTMRLCVGAASSPFVFGNCALQHTAVRSGVELCSAARGGVVRCSVVRAGRSGTLIVCGVFAWCVRCVWCVWCVWCV